MSDLDAYELAIYAQLAAEFFRPEPA